MSFEPPRGARLWIGIWFILFAGCADPSPKTPSKNSQAVPHVESDDVAAPAVVAKSADAFRFATYNASLYRRNAGDLVADLESGKDQRAAAIAEVIQRVRPDVLLINEFDYDAEGRALKAFRELYLQDSQNGQTPIDYEFSFTAPVNTGEPTEHDMDNDGELGGAGDAIGYGYFPGQYGMVVLSRFPIDESAVRTLQKFLWRDMPGAKLSKLMSGDEPYYSDEETAVLRLASKSFWDVPIQLGADVGLSTIHFLVAHPTPPVFDGPEDRNGLRNFDEIRMIADYISPDRSGYLVDDAGQAGGLKEDACFVIAGDLNSDPIDGSGYSGAMDQIVSHPRVTDAAPPSSTGGAAAAKTANVNSDHNGDPANDTADFGPDGSGNLRVDYVLPSRTLDVVKSGVFWPRQGEPGYDAIQASDHRLVWIDIRAESANACAKLKSQPE